MIIIVKSNIKLDKTHALEIGVNLDILNKLYIHKKKIYLKNYIIIRFMEQAKFRFLSIILLNIIMFTKIL